MTKEKNKWEIHRTLGCIGDPEKWHIELNFMSWDNQEPKYDIRKWNKGRQIPGKGFTLTRQELEEMADFIDAEINYLTENE